MDEISEALADPQTVTHPAVYDALLTRIRREAPLRWMTPEGFRPFWLVAKHADLLEVESRADIFLSAPRTELIPRKEEEQIAAATGGNQQMMRTILHMDGAEHRAYRGLTQPAFMPPNLCKLEAGITAIAKEYVQRMVELGDACDFVKDIAVWYPLRVILLLLDLPPEAAPEILRLTQNFVERKDQNIVGEGPSEQVAVQSAQEILDYVSKLYESRKAAPGDDLASVIATAKIGGEPISPFEAMSYLLLVVTAGHETTSATTAGGMLALLQNPGELERLQADLTLLPGAVDEMLRWVSPVKHFFRTAVKDYELRGQKIKAGDSLMLCFPSANRDEEVFADPFSFKIDRKPNPHTTFGYGPHACLGQHLGKMEIRILLKEILENFDGLQLAGEPAWVATTFAGGLKTLPIRYRRRQLPG